MTYDYSVEHTKIGLGFKIKPDPDAPAVPVEPPRAESGSGATRFLGLAQLKSEGTLASFDVGSPGASARGMKRKDVPARPKEALRLLLDTSDRVFQHGSLRWRYAGKRLVRFIEYHPEGTRSNWPFAREWHTRRPK